MGNSEVGHQNIGAGKRVLQDYTRVNELIKDGSFFQNPALLKAIEHVKKNQSQLHICGLLGNGGVHAHETHLEALLKLAALHDIERVYIHAFTDGRDTSPTGGIDFMKHLQARAAEIGGAHAAQVATVTGRYYAMDRDNRWDRTGATYFAMTHGEGQRAASAVQAIQQSYDQKVTDEFILPTVIIEDDHPVVVVKAGDALIHYNFRPDRARQLTKAFVMQDLPPQAEGKFERGPRIEDLQYVMMTEYEEGLDAAVAFVRTRWRCRLRCRFRCRSAPISYRRTEKYAHVTYFINGRRERLSRRRSLSCAFTQSANLRSPARNERRRGHRYRHRAHSQRAIRSGDHELRQCRHGRHTGVIEAAIWAVEAVDSGVGRVVDATLEVGGGLIITADHGNAEQLIEYDTGKPFTAHTTYPVPLYLVVPQYAHAHLRRDGMLADVSPTILHILGIPQPKDMTGTSLIVP